MRPTALTPGRQVSSFRVVDTVPLKPERLAQLEEYARRRGKSTADALDDLLADYLEWERQDYQQAVDAVREGQEDVKAGRSAPAEQFLDDFARKHGLVNPPADDDLTPWPDQRAFLSNVSRVSRAQMETIAREAERRGTDSRCPSATRRR